jgi:hypothetical protein
VSRAASIPEQVAPFLRVFGAREREEVDVRPRLSDDVATGARMSGPAELGLESRKPASRGLTRGQALTTSRRCAMQHRLTAFQAQRDLLGNGCGPGRCRVPPTIPHQEVGFTRV